ncbi:MAG: radical SAM family heme chaperone HemW [Thermodesulfobacteriota bacterium]|nr:radical SAM family heme chaperone HemW [Thermodesulfobacteriota bacterium]
MISDHSTNSPPPASIHQTPGFYIHIPFCRQKCRYCDFYSSTGLKGISVFARALKTEMELRQATISGPFGSLYIGGGTPSVLPAAMISDILKNARHCFSFLDHAEITVEANPESLTPAWLRRLKASGVNRLNIGIQSFNDTMLAFLGRIHSASQATKAIADARSAGFDNIGIDLIYGIPGQTQRHLQQDLDIALDLMPSHIACYMLTYEANTPLTIARDKGTHKAPPDALTSRFFAQVAEVLTNGGYHHYEISNFARTPAHMAAHNTKYWRRIPYSGFGPSAHSYTGTRRTWNVRSVDQYTDMLSQDRLPVADQERLNREQHMLEAVYLGLRMAEGIDIQAFEREFSLDFSEAFAPVVAAGPSSALLKVKNRRCFLTDRGMQFHETVVRDFYEAFNHKMISAEKGTGAGLQTPDGVI